MAFVSATPLGNPRCRFGCAPQSLPSSNPTKLPVPVTPRLALANRPPPSSPVPYVGTPPSSKPGRLRFDPTQRFRPPPNPPPQETRRDTAWQNSSLVSRSLAIWTFIARLLATNWLHDREWSYFPSSRTPETLARRRRALAAYARDRILTLGPTMVKVGQLASTRADLLPSEVVDELRLLQDRVPAFSWQVAEKVLQAEYASPVDQVFQYFEKVPIAAASLGQVHRAILPSGEHVVVKIQRPKLSNLFDLDLFALKVVARYLNSSKRYGGNGRDWIGIYEECSRVLYEEIDYEREGRSCMRFRANFANAGVDWVKVPYVYDEYTTKNVLCLQYLPGIKISDVESLKRAGLDTKVVANRVANAFIRQVLDFAFFSCDPHPGNVAVSVAGGSAGSLIFYDFGMVGELNPGIKDRLIDILQGVLERDADVVMSALVDLDALVLPADPAPVRRSIQFFLDTIGNRPSREQTVSAIGEDLYATAYDKPFRLPAASIFLLRAFSTIEGLAKGLDSKFEFNKVALPYADDLLKDRTGGLDSPQTVARSLARSILTGQADGLSRELAQRAVGAGTSAVRAVSRIEKIEKTLAQLERGDIKLRSRSTETERLLRKQYSLSESSHFLLSSGTTAIAATQLYASGSMEPAALMAGLSAILGLVFLRKQVKLNKKDSFTNS